MSPERDAKRIRDHFSKNLKAPVTVDVPARHAYSHWAQPVVHREAARVPRGIP